MCVLLMPIFHIHSAVQAQASRATASRVEASRAMASRVVARRATVSRATVSRVGDSRATASKVQASRAGASKAMDKTTTAQVSWLACCTSHSVWFGGFLCMLFYPPAMYFCHSV